MPLDMPLDNSEAASGGLHRHNGQYIGQSFSMKENVDNDTVMQTKSNSTDGDIRDNSVSAFRRQSYSLDDLRQVQHQTHQLGINIEKAKSILRRAFTYTTVSRLNWRRKLKAKMGQNMSADPTVYSGKHQEKSCDTTPPVSAEEFTQLKDELNATKKLLYEREQNILKLTREIHKLNSVLEQTSPNPIGSAPTNGPTKKCGVSGECISSSEVSISVSIKKVTKDFHSKQLIKDALLDNSFLRHFLDSQQLKLIIDAMYEKEFSRGQFICIQGQYGSHLYVIAYGHCEIIANNNQLVNQLGPGKCFGELAILYNCTRTASVKALTKTRLWVLDRKVFQMIMMKTGKDRHSQYRNFLLSVPLLQNLNQELIGKIVDSIEVDYYPSGHYICRHGSPGDSFYIISSGSVSVTQTCGDREQSLRTLTVGDYFGEQSLLSSTHLRTANVISQQCECLILDGSSFHSLIGELSELKTKHYDNKVNESINKHSISNDDTDMIDAAVSELKLDHFDVIVTLGIGGFGRVDLVKVTKDPNRIYALKSCSKRFIRSTQQEQHIKNERTVQRIVSQHQFVVTLFRTFKDEHFVYFLMEASLGGELWTLLRHRGVFEESEAKFYIGCVIEALQFLHSKAIIYRDLKPENCLLDSFGYLKITDFGFSKTLSPGEKTWTFCGTPEYVAPEVILNRGHDFAVDFWSLGIFAYELITGMPPFTSSDPLKTYNIILRGFDAIGFDETLFSKNCVNLIRRLCRENPCERIGVQKNGILDLKRHKWFSGFNFDQLIQRSVNPPIVPHLSGPTDTRYFDVVDDEHMSVHNCDADMDSDNTNDTICGSDWDRLF